MDRPTTLAEAMGRLTGHIIGTLLVILVASFVLMKSWNQSVPEVFGLMAIEYRHAVGMVGVVWAATLLNRE